MLKNQALKFFKTFLLVLFFQLGIHAQLHASSVSYTIKTNIDSILNHEKPINKSIIKLISWNIQDFGQTKDNSEIAIMANLLKDYDIIAIQEVVAKHPAGAQKVAQLADELNRKGAKWDYSISNPTKSPSVYMSERYAFIFKTSKVQLLGKPFLDAEVAAQMVREPFIAQFKAKSTQKTFTVVNFHSRKHNDHPELEIIHFKNYLKRFNTECLLIAGDFNLNETHSVWNNLYKQGFASAVKNTKTTLKRKCSNGEYRNHSIDNIFYSNKITLVNANAVDFVKSCQNLLTARFISDHLPVFLSFSIQD
ncbi:endonuclease/exonuclease/phosphatase family protein [Tamlana sp. 62-3]|uniref:Endonuclease/exonuclease/phosphatase family protein n=1 Tax=Neotamlana sargassicola TaxID=2883125 RepID=A0A9X1L879_9FLAO|nr:endonuclease/exonuclease/phosphatase family protein [Tamlana sargassicola]MCB4808578.1 endonuclease/exonuclease/phosphatase family protein [Tamlana sargassicola]